MMKEQNNQNQKQSGVPIWNKYALNVCESAEYFGIGEKKIRQMISCEPDAEYILHIGNKILIKRTAFETYLDRCTYL